MRDHRWMWAVAARCALYGLFSGAVFVMVSALIVFLCFPLLRLGVASYLGKDIVLALVYGWLVVSLITIATAVLGGAVAGFHSPPREGCYPFHSPFFHCVLKNAVRGFFLGALLGCATGLLYFFFVRSSFGMAITLILSFGGQIYGFARGINLARRAASALPPEPT